MKISRSMRISAASLALVLSAGLLALRSVREPSHAEAAVVVAPPMGPELKPAPSTPIAEEKARLGDDETWRPEWDAVIEKALPAELLAPQMGKTVRQFCPRFRSMAEPDKRAFWAYFFQALSGAEAGLKPTSNVQHTEPQVAVTDHVSHRMVRSEGLLQLTYEDSRRYGCDFDWDADKHRAEHDPDKTILQPENNLLCGVNILENQIVVQKKPLITKTSYWSTLRPDWPGYRTFIKQMSNVPSACSARPISKPEISRSQATPTPIASR